MPVTNIVDALITYRIIRMLVTPWTDTDAYKLGIIDKNGTPLKSTSELTTSQEQAAYSVLQRLVFKLKRILGKIPLVNKNLASYAAALWLIKECNELGEEPENMEQLFEEINNSLVEFAQEKEQLMIFMKEEPTFELFAVLRNEEAAANAAGGGAVAGLQGDAGRSAKLMKKPMRRNSIGEPSNIIPKSRTN